MNYFNEFNSEAEKYFNIIETQKSILQNANAIANIAKSPMSEIKASAMPNIVTSTNSLQYKHQTALNNVRKTVGMFANVLKQQQSYYSIFGIATALNEYTSAMTHIKDKFNILSDIRQNFVELYPEYDINEEDIDDTEAIDKIIVSKLLNPSTGEEFKKSDNKLIITALPINERILRYFADNPQELYKIKPRYFEELMATIYHKLGFDVELTRATRDGGKDIILKEHNAIGDFVYYVECKHHNKMTNKVGVGVIRQLYGTVSADKVNGGIIATNSFFTKEVRNFILNSNCQCQMNLHDGNYINKLLKKVIG